MSSLTSPLALAAALAACSATAATPAFRDLNHNGRLDLYENRRLPVDARIEDLLGQMTVEEKVGSLLHATLPGNTGATGQAPTGYDMNALAPLIAQRKLTSFLTRLTIAPRDFAAANNAVQRLAEQSRLGIPATISTDPRNHFQ